MKWRQFFHLAIHVCCEMRATTYYSLPILALVSIAPDIVTYISYVTYWPEILKADTVELLLLVTKIVLLLFKHADILSRFVMMFSGRQNICYG